MNKIRPELRAQLDLVFGSVIFVNRLSKLVMSLPKETRMLGVVGAGG
jgi:hypothetical protein